MRTTDARVRRALTAVSAGRPVVVIDDNTPDVCGYLVFAAERATTRLLAFTVRHTSGYIRVALPECECARLNLPPMCHPEPDTGPAAAHRVSVDRCGTGTGISAADRARTVAALACPDSVADDFQRPGHVIPVATGSHGVLRHPVAAEAAADLAELAGCRRAAVLSDIVSDRAPAAMADSAELFQFADRYGLAAISIAELVAYRRRTEAQVTRLAETVMPTVYGDFRVIGYRGSHDDSEHLVVIAGAADSGAPIPLHVHVECLTGDVFGSSACRCGAELDAALAAMAAQGCGVVIYLRPCAAVRACSLPGSDASSVTEATATVAAVLRDLGVFRVRLYEDAPEFGLALLGAIGGTTKVGVR